MSTIRTGVGVAILLGIVLSALLWVAAQPAYAQSLDECQTDIAALRAKTLSTTFAGQNAAKDQAGLIAKLDSASAKLEQGKLTDALANLQSFQTKVITLEEQGKISDSDVSTLVVGAQEAIDCVQGLIEAQVSPTVA